MKKINYMKAIQTANTLDELNKIKENLLSECKIRENKIRVSNLLSNIDNFGSAKSLFESIAPSLMSKKEGKKLINIYTKIIKENKSLKTLFAYIEGLNENNTTDSKKAYITEALSITKKINYNEYVKGIGDILNIISESFNILGDEFILENASYDEKASNISKSLLFLSMTNKNIRNLNEYMSHIDNVCSIITENSAKKLNVDLSLDEIVSEMKKNVNSTNVENIFNTENKEETFLESKKMCLNIISEQKLKNNDADIVNKLNDIESKLMSKNYSFDTFTKDMLYMTELQEVLK